MVLHAVVVTLMLSASPDVTQALAGPPSATHLAMAAQTPASLLFASSDSPGGAAATEGGDLDAHRKTLLHAQRVLKVTTTASLLVTGTLGTITALNRPTLFGEGRCAKGIPIFGSYGCNELSIVHGTSAFLSLLLYTGTATVSLMYPGDDHRVPAGRPGVSGWFYTLVSYVALVGLAAQPVLGLTAHIPTVIGVNGQSAEQFSKALRTVHVGLGYLTIAAVATSLALEF